MGNKNRPVAILCALALSAFVSPSCAAQALPEAALPAIPEPSTRTKS